MSTDIPAYLIQFIRPQFSAKVRVAALWCVINLCWQEGDRAEGNRERLLALRSRGLEAQLRAIRDDVSMEIKVRDFSAARRVGPAEPSAIPQGLRRVCGWRGYDSVGVDWCVGYVQDRVSTALKLFERLGFQKDETAADAASGAADTLMSDS